LETVLRNQFKRQRSLLAAGHGIDRATTILILRDYPTHGLSTLTIKFRCVQWSANCHAPPLYHGLRTRCCDWHRLWAWRTRLVLWSCGGSCARIRVRLIGFRCLDWIKIGPGKKDRG